MSDHEIQTWLDSSSPEDRARAMSVAMYAKQHWESLDHCDAATRAAGRAAMELEIIALRAPRR